MIVVSYFLFKGLDKLPLGTFLHPQDFSPREHTVTTIIATAASFSQSLGLSGGIAPLQQFLGRFEEYQTLGLILPWTIIAAFFGLFVGLIFYKHLQVWRDCSIQ